MWISLVIAIITFLLSKTTGVSTSKAALGALAAGVGTYYVATETDWGKANLGSLDAALAGTTKTTPMLHADGTPVIDPVTGQPVMTSAPSTSKTGESTISSVGQWISSHMGAVAALGLGAAAGSSLSPWLLIAGLFIAYKVITK